MIYFSESGFATISKNSFTGDRFSPANGHYEIKKQK